MSTSSNIAIIFKDKTAQAIYCHNDGYLEHNGLILAAFYHDLDKVKKLFSLGDLSSLSIFVDPTTNEKHDFNHRQNDVCVAYHRDRGDKLNQRVYQRKEDLFDSIHEDYNYVYKESTEKWYLYKNKKLLSLNDLILNNVQEKNVYIDYRQYLIEVRLRKEKEKILKENKKIITHIDLNESITKSRIFKI